MATNQAISALALAASMAAVALAQQSAKPSKHPPPSKQVTSITLPDYSAKPLPGPDVEVYQKNCLLCHSSRYVAMQPNFSRSTWEKEVKKMVDAYGATIPEADQPKIVDYLVAVRGVPESKPAETVAH